MGNIQPMPIDLTKLLAPYKGEWVALSKDEKEVLGHGRTIDEALQGARERGEDHPILIKSPDQYSALLL